ncbi:TOBE domain-containing protein [Comamonas sp. GB3 AK4-5]|uniref:TOBE domain-containing protein n=1 Tax=Comamonas sp. GB3 AK4-5 TaxID=3231487 RepID=UPI00351E5275
MADIPASSAASVSLPAPALLEALGHGMSDKRLMVLRQLALNGSISQAARDSGISYKAAWQALDTLTNLAGITLVERSVGGAGGGGATLTAAGHALLRAADAMEQARAEVLARLQGAGLPPPVLARLAVRTSMRNQWPCTVDALQTEGSRVMVQLHCAATSTAKNAKTAPPALQAQITHESAELLALAPGRELLAMCKATAVQVLSLEEADAAQDRGLQATYWQGTLARMDAEVGGYSHELAVRLPGGVHVVGFGAQGPWHEGMAVAVHIPAAAVVLALVDGA